MNNPRVGAVSYLNTKPLVEGLAELAPDWDLVLDLPSRLADELRSGGYDVALIPSIEAIQPPSGHERLTIVSNACIGCHGPVWSVKLLSRKPLADIRTLALDEGSRTSCVLARILLKHKYGVQPICSSLHIDQPWQDSETDAVLIIGDRAMNAADPRFPIEVDLGQAWCEWTGLPFVFAVWTARVDSGNSFDLRSCARVLSRARDQGLARLDSIATDQADRYQLTHNECLRYLRDNLHFTLGENEKAGLQLFYDYAAKMSLVDLTTKPQFHSATV